MKIKVFLKGNHIIFDRIFLWVTLLLTKDQLLRIKETAFFFFFFFKALISEGCVLHFYCFTQNSFYIFWMFFMCVIDSGFQATKLKKNKSVNKWNQSKIWRWWRPQSSSGLSAGDEDGNSVPGGRSVKNRMINQLFFYLFHLELKHQIKKLVN